MTEILIVGLVLVLLAMVFAWCLCRIASISDERMEAIMKEMREVRQDNRTLTECLVRSEGRPIVFKKPDRIPSEGWFEGKPKVQVKEG